MTDSFSLYLKKQLLEYVEAERKKGVPLPEIEKALLNAGHEKNIIDEVISELKAEHAGKKVATPKGIEGDLMSQLKAAFSQFMSKASEKEIKEAKEELSEEGTEEVVEEVIEEAEVIEEKTMIEGAAFFLYLLGIGALILFSAGSTDSQLVKVAMGFSPAILNCFISFIALNLADNVPVYVFIPLAISGAFYALGKFTSIPAFSNFEVEGLAIVNFVIGFIFNITIIYLRFVKPESMKRRIIRREPQPKEAPSVPAPTLPEVPASTHHHAAQHTTHHERKEIKELKEEFNI